MVENLDEEAKIFRLASDFSCVSGALKKISRGEYCSINDTEREKMGEAGELFRHLDWYPQFHGLPEAKRDPKFIILATELRPLFNPVFLWEADLSFDDRKYVEAVYDLFKSAGQRVDLSTRRIADISRIFDHVADSLRSRLPRGNI